MKLQVELASEHAQFPAAVLALPIISGRVERGHHESRRVSALCVDGYFHEIIHRAIGLSGREVSMGEYADFCIDVCGSDRVIHAPAAETRRDRLADSVILETNHFEGVV
jgi:hypothetical protein